ncbi:PQQ-binding-like beta-propeller repeat protein [Fulvivirgaceae bacterium PWU4]|uniref:PQQ-binding-like beta-propeller repeat protein n=1 Tax=Chryseosolibacter histidini TaxID=2782349 RepID=A0AAP2GMY8_9BACT|nr:PQQ-binding-like beta-propeller repeat protein [Chryseosolibacter histidini]MBT1696325.1 PQQ-binding-like beta-propeller repeat protein [Chryseosolibacter histidini]
MKKITRTFLLAVMCTYAVAVFAQPKTAPAWSAKFKSPINWQRVHSLGYLIVSTNDGLYGVNPGDGKILWENKNYPALSADRFQEVDGTEFVSISFLTDKSSTIPMQAIIEVVGGKVLFDSQKEQIGVLSRHVLPSSGRLLVIGVRPNTLSASLFMYEIASGKQLWANDDLFKADQAGGKGLLGKLQAMGQQLSNLQSLTSEPVELQDQSMIITHPNYVIRLNSGDGKVLWKNSIQPSKRGQVYFSPFKKNVVYIGTEVESETGSGFTTTSSSNNKEPQKFYTNLYYAFDLASGNALWKEPAKENDKLNQVIMHEKGIIICPRSSQKPTINLVDYETGKTMWGNKGKGVKAQGSVVSYITTEKGILITTAFDNAWNNKAEEYYLNLLDPNTGTLKFEKSVKLKGDLVRSEMVPKGLLFITTREVNILDTNTGSLLWGNSIEAGTSLTGEKVRPFPTGSKGDKLYVFSSKEDGLFEIDKTTGIFRKMTSTKVEFGGKELPKAIDVVADGVLLYSDQNVLKFGFDGLLKYSKYYPAPRQPALVRALLMAEAVRAAYIGAAASAYSAAFAQASAQTNDAAGKAMGQELSKGFGQLGQAGFAYSSRALKEFNARYKASQNTPNFVMMMTTQEKKGNQLIQVNKTNGEVASAVDIKNDKEPEYDVDQIFNYIYYRPTAAEIVCYKL